MKLSDKDLHYALWCAERHTGNSMYEEAAADLDDGILEIEGYEQVKDVCSNVGSHAIDDKPLTDGEIAMIRALRKVRVRCVFAEGSYLTYIDDNGKLDSTGGVVAFDVSILKMKYNEQIRAALKQIKQEQEARNETE